jgi:hypothetical protein
MNGEMTLEQACLPEYRSPGRIYPVQEVSGCSPWRLYGASYLSSGEPQKIEERVEDTTTSRKRTEKSGEVNGG